jgi:HlyD family secretion protein
MMAKTSSRAMAVVSACALLAGCHKPAAGAKTAAASQPMAVSVTTVKSMALRGGLSSSGLLVSQYEAAVSTQLNGYRVAQVYVDQGAQVKAGQPMAKLDDTLLHSQVVEQQAMVAQQQVAAERSQAEAQRVAGLDNAGVLPEEQIIERRLAARSAKAAVAAAQAQLDDLLTREKLMIVRAPVSGLVLTRTVRPGDIAAPATPMFTIATDDIVELNAEVPESNLPQIKAGDRADVALPNGATVNGVVRVVSPQVDAQTKLGHVRVTLPVRADLRPGGYGRAIFLQSSRSGIVVPENAVHFDVDGASVMVLQADDRVRRAPVRTGERAQGLVELTQGPPAGTTILLGGGAFVLDGDKVTPVHVDDSLGDTGAGR